MKKRGSKHSIVEVIHETQYCMILTDVKWFLGILFCYFVIDVFICSLSFRYKIYWVINYGFKFEVHLLVFFLSRFWSFIPMPSSLGLTHKSQVLRFVLIFCYFVENNKSNSYFRSSLQETRQSNNIASF